MILQMYQKVNEYIFYLIIFYLGIGVIKKETKNQVQIKPEFYGHFKKTNSIELNEEKVKENSDNKRLKKKSSKKYKTKIKEINNEYNKVKVFIKNMNEILNKYQYENINNNSGNNIYLINKDIYPLNIDKNKNLNLIDFKLNKGINNESEIEKEKEIIYFMEKNKKINKKNNNYNKENNSLFIGNNGGQIDPIDTEKKNSKYEEQEREKVKEKEKEKENNGFLYNKHISINNGSNYLMGKNIQEKKEDSILSSNSLFEKYINFMDSNIYLQNFDAQQTFY